MPDATTIEDVLRTLGTDDASTIDIYELPPVVGPASTNAQRTQERAERMVAGDRVARRGSVDVTIDRRTAEALVNTGARRHDSPAPLPAA